MKRSWEIDRRACLRGAGATIGLPFLEGMIPGIKRAGAAGISAPKRIVIFVFGGGTPDTTKITSGEGRPGSWRPTTTGPDYQMTPILQPLADAGLRDDILVVSNLHNAIGELGVGPSAGGDHPRSQIALLTGVDPQYADGPNTTAGISVDQVAANGLKSVTPGLPSLVVGVRALDYPLIASWKNATTLLNPTEAPSDAFKQVFGDTTVDPTTVRKRLAYTTTVLGYAKKQVARLQDKLGTSDKQTLAKYLEGIVDLEQQIQATSTTPNQCDAGDLVTNNGGSIPVRLRQMLDSIALAFQCDRTRVAVVHLTLQAASFEWLGLPARGFVSHHDDLQHGGDPKIPDHDQRLDAYTDATTWMIGQFAYLVRKLKDAREGTGSVLDNTIAVATTEISYGNGHSMRNMPVVVAGRGGSVVRPGRHIEVPDVSARNSRGEVVPGQPIANLWLTMLRAAGVDAPSFGNSTGPLSLT